MDNQTKDEIRLVEVQSKNVSDRLVTELVYLRKSKKLTQQDIADRTGMQRANVARIEGKRYTPTIEVLLKYASSLGMELDFILKEK